MWIRHQNLLRVRHLWIGAVIALASFGGCAVEVDVAPTCLSESCDPPNLVDAGTDVTIDAGRDTAVDAPTPACAQADGPCIVGVWPPGHQRLNIKASQLQASVNVARYGEFLFASAIVWPGEPGPNILVMMSRPEFQLWSTSVGFSPEFYEAPPLIFGKRNGAVSVTAPHNRLVTEGRTRFFAATHIRIDDVGAPSRTFDPALRSFELGSLMPEVVLQPAASAFVTEDLRGKVWVGASSVGKAAVWAIDGTVIGEAVDQTAQMDVCTEGGATLRSERVVTLSDDPGAPGYTWCVTADGVSHLVVLPRKDSRNFDGFDFSAHPVAPTLGARVPDPFLATMVAPTGDLRSLSPAIVTLGVAEPSLSPVSDLSGLLDQFVAEQRQAGGCLNSLAAEATLDLCASDADGVALADLDGDGRPELIALVRLSTSCDGSQAGDAIPASVTTLLRFRVGADGGVSVLPFSASGQTSECLPGFATGPLVADLDGDGEQEFLLGLVGDTRLSHAGDNYGLRLVDDTGEVTPFELPDAPDETSTTFDLPVALGRFVDDTTDDSLDLVILRVEGRGEANAIQPARLITLSLSGVDPLASVQWARRLGDAGHSGIWAATP